MRPSKGKKTLVELAQQFGLHPNKITQWRGQLLEGATAVLCEGARAKAAPAIEVKALHAKIRDLTLANDFFSGRARQGRTAGARKTMIDHSHELPLSSQAKALGISRGRICYL